MNANDGLLVSELDSLPVFASNHPESKEPKLEPDHGTAFQKAFCRSRRFSMYSSVAKFGAFQRNCQPGDHLQESNVAGMMEKLIGMWIVTCPNGSENR